MLTTFFTSFEIMVMPLRTWLANCGLYLRMRVQRLRSSICDLTSSTRRRLVHDDARSFYTAGKTQIFRQMRLLLCANSWRNAHDEPEPVDKNATRLKAASAHGHDRLASRSDAWRQHTGRQQRLGQFVSHFVENGRNSRKRFDKVADKVRTSWL